MPERRTASTTGEETHHETAGPGAQLPVEALLAIFASCETGRFPSEALTSMLARRDELVEPLLAEVSCPIAELRARMETGDQERSYRLHLVALYLLALWEEPRAYRPLVAQLAEDTDFVLQQMADMVMEDLHVILARIYDGSDLGTLQAIIENDAADPYVRNACLRAMHVMERLGKLPREPVTAYYGHVLEKLRRESNAIWADELIGTVAELQEPSLRPAIDRWFRDGLVEETFLSPASIDVIYADDRPPFDEHVLLGGPPEDLVEHLASSVWLEPGDMGEADDPFAELTMQELRDMGILDDLDDMDEDEGMGNAPLVRAGRKIGRNEPCPCGSGRKYKKCCLGKED